MKPRALLTAVLAALTASSVCGMFPAKAHHAKAQHAGSVRLLRQGRRAHHLRHLAQPNVDMGPPVNETNILAQQKAYLYNMLDCQGVGAAFSSSANAFLTDFKPYIGNLWSVKLCGKGTFFFFGTPDMQTLSTLGHVTRCGEAVSKHMGSCQCVNLPPETRALVQSFTLQYC